MPFSGFVHGIHCSLPKIISEIIKRYRAVGSSGSPSAPCTNVGVLQRIVIIVIHVYLHIIGFSAIRGNNIGFSIDEIIKIDFEFPAAAELLTQYIIIVEHIDDMGTAIDILYHQTAPLVGCIDPYAIQIYIGITHAAPVPIEYPYTNVVRYAVGIFGFDINIGVDDVTHINENLGHGPEHFAEFVHIININYPHAVLKVVKCDRTVICSIAHVPTDVHFGTPYRIILMIIHVYPNVIGFPTPVCSQDECFSIDE